MCINFLIDFVTHGRDFLLPMCFTGTNFDMPVSIELLNLTHSSSTVIEWELLSISFLDDSMKFLNSGQLALLYIEHFLGFCFRIVGLALIMAETTSWSEMPGRIWMFLTKVGLEIRMRSKILSYLVFSLTICVRS